MSTSSREMIETPSSSGKITPVSSSNITEFNFHPDSPYVSTPTDTKDNQDACMDNPVNEDAKDGPAIQSLRTANINYENVPEFNVRFLWVNEVHESWAETQKSFRWEANLYVQTRDVGQLMREGFFLSPDQEIKDTGCITPNSCPGEPNYRGWKHTRHYIFVDPNMKWTAHLHVCAYQMAELARFRLADLKPSHLAFSWAYNPEGFQVYGYSLFKPEDNFNTIYEDVPLKGIWPWPKEKPIQAPIPAGEPQNNDDKKQKGKEKMRGRHLPLRIKEDSHQDDTFRAGRQFHPYNGVPSSLVPGWHPGFTPPIFHRSPPEE